MTQQHDSESFLKAWIKAEQWFMVGTGIALLVIAAASAFGGLLANPDNEAPLAAMNTVIALLLAGAGIWSLWASTRSNNVQQMVENLAAQAPNRLRINGALLVVIALLFFLDGLSRGAIGVLLVGLMLIVAAIWSFWRAEQVIALKNL